jgi:uncharacterized peroxidase-related enzyme
MSRIAIPDEDAAPEGAKEILGNVRKQLGFVPKLHRLMSVSPNVLSGWLGLMSNLSKTLDVKTRDSIALAVSDANGCDYCLAAHSYVSATFAKMTADDIALGRQGSSTDPKRAAAAAFAKRVIETRGRVSDADLTTIRSAGFSEAQVVEIVASAAQFLMTNFLNNVADTEVDFPPTASTEVAA